MGRSRRAGPPRVLARTMGSGGAAAPLMGRPERRRRACPSRPGLARRVAAPRPRARGGPGCCPPPSPPGPAAPRTRSTGTGGGEGSPGQPRAHGGAGPGMARDGPGRTEGAGDGDSPGSPGAAPGARGGQRLRTARGRRPWTPGFGRGTRGAGPSGLRRLPAPVRSPRTLLLSRTPPVPVRARRDGAAASVRRSGPDCPRGPGGRRGPTTGPATRASRECLRRRPRSVQSPPGVRHGPARSPGARPGPAPSVGAGGKDRGERAGGTAGQRDGR